MIYLSTNETAIEIAKSIIDDIEIFAFLNTWFTPSLYTNDPEVDKQFECTIQTFIFIPNQRFLNLTKQEQETALDWITNEFISETDCDQVNDITKVNYYPTEQKLQISLLGYW